MIRFGPAGIPLSCKGRTLVDGVEDVYALGLSAMELQLVRMNDVMRHPMEEEVGLPLREITSDLALQLIRTDGDSARIVSDPDEKVKEGDQLVVMISGPAANYRELTYARKLAKQLDITLSIHSPYYMDLTSEGEEGEQSVRILQWAGIIARELDADPVITHVGLYDDRPPAAAYAIAKKNLKAVSDWYKKQGIKARIGIEMSGRQEVFGTMEEVLRLCKEVDGVVPIVNLPHIHARGGGSLLEKDDFLSIFKQTAKFVKGPHYVHFSGVEHQDGNEMRYTPIKKGDLRFEPMAEALIQELYDMTLISGSPLLEHDAMYMRVIFERNFAKTVSKAAAEAYDEDEEEEKKLVKKAAAKGKAAKAARDKAAKGASAPKGKTPAKGKPTAKGQAKGKPAPKAQAKGAAAKGKPASKAKAVPAKGKPAPAKGKPVQAKSTAKPSGRAAVKGKPAPKKAPPAKPGVAKPAAKKAAPKKSLGKPAKPAPKKANVPVKKPAPKKTPSSKPGAVVKKLATLKTAIKKAQAKKAAGKPSPAKARPAPHAGKSPSRPAKRRR